MKTRIDTTYKNYNILVGDRLFIKADFPSFLVTIDLFKPWYKHLWCWFKYTILKTNPAVHIYTVTSVDSDGFTIED